MRRRLQRRRDQQQHDQRDDRVSSSESDIAPDQGKNAVCLSQLCCYLCDPPANPQFFLLTALCQFFFIDHT